MHYRICEVDDDVKKLQEEVNQLIQDGWQPIGGVAAGYSDLSGKWWYYQAMIKDDAPHSESQEGIQVR